MDDNAENDQIENADLETGGHGKENVRTAETSLHCTLQTVT